jgi:hypothetical protein
MGRSQFVHPVALTAIALVAFVLMGCGEPERLLTPVNADEIYGEGGGGFGITSKDPADVGVVRGVVKFVGKPYKQQTFTLSDKFCISRNPDGIASQAFLFDAATGGLQGAFVYIQKGISNWDAVPAPSTPVVLDQVNCEYVPHVAMLRVGQPLVVKSQDSTLHNVAYVARNNGVVFNKPMGSPGKLVPTQFSRPELERPVLVKCDVHGWMSAYISILPHPFCAITGKDGSFELKGVPPGKYRILIWHENFKDEPVTREITVTKNQELKLDPVEFTR